MEKTSYSQFQEGFLWTLLAVRCKLASNQNKGVALQFEGENGHPFAEEKTPNLMESSIEHAGKFSPAVCNGFVRPGR